ncbi:MAG: DUF1592 domain-containing protein [Myxococcaceae bacterium]
MSAFLLGGCTGEAGLQFPGDALTGSSALCANHSDARVRRLTREEFNATASASLGIAVTEGDGLAAEDRVLGFTNHDRLEVSPLFGDQVDGVAQTLAQRAVASITTLAPCAAGANETTCATQFIDAFAKKAYRRPLSTEERADLVALYTAGRTGADYKTGIALVIQGVIESSSFLYRTELGDPANTESIKSLTPHEIASELAFTVTASPPDATLTAAAEAGLLGDPEEREAHARRLLGTAGARAQLKEFVVEWLGLQNIDSIQKDASAFPEFSTTLRDSMKAETDTFLTSVIASEKVRLPELLAADYTFADSTLAAFYGLKDRPGTTPQRVKLPPERAGLLTQAGLLASYAHAADSSPILRGKLVRTRMLCTEMPPPPASIIVAPPAPDPTRTTRERVAAHTSNASCAGCHRLMDPLGFGMEDFDGLGKHRTTENNKTVDASGSLEGTSDRANEGAFTGGGELARMLANNTDVSACVNLQLFRFGMGRQEEESDQCNLDSSLAQLRGKELDLNEVMVAMVRSTGFIQRKVVLP